ncbi:MAG TPA: alkaline phosphatase PhoX [Actinomycetota bacterium]|nr:alkaline phosphatase PhoX [Actinomycetota bacterium]
MRTIDRRTFLRRSALVAAGTIGAAAGPFSGLVVRAAHARPPLAPDNAGYGPLGPVPDLRDGLVRLWLPAGFRYRSFGVRGTPLTEEATATPGRHDGMAAFGWRGGRVRLIRNHEQFQPTSPPAAFGDASGAYDPRAPGGTTTLELTPRAEEVRSWVSLNGSTFNCAGGPTPWRSWLTCEETPNGVDQQRSFLIGPDQPDDLTYTRKHGYLFEVPVSRGPGELEVGQPIRSAGRFPHEAAAVDPSTGIVYMTEDDFAYPSGFFRYIPPTNPFAAKRVEDGGRLQVLGVVPEGAAGPVTTDLHTGQTPGTTYRVAWIDIEDPDPTFAPGLSNDEAARLVFQEGEAKGGARFSRLEGMNHWGGKIFFVSTEGGGPFDSDPPPNASAGFGDGYGQVWMYDTRAETLTLLFESPGPDVLDFPDNIVASPRRKSVLICEDSGDGNMLRGLTRDGLLFDFALNAISGGTDEFAGATFSPDTQVLYANMQSNGMTYAIWGPWHRGPL